MTDCLCLVYIESTVMILVLLWTENLQREIALFVWFLGTWTRGDVNVRSARKCRTFLPPLVCHHVRRERRLWSLVSTWLFLCGDMTVVTVLVFVSSYAVTTPKATQAASKVSFVGLIAVCGLDLLPNLIALSFFHQRGCVVAWHCAYACSFCALSSRSGWPATTRWSRNYCRTQHHASVCCGATDFFQFLFSRQFR